MRSLLLCVALLLIAVPAAACDSGDSGKTDTATVTKPAPAKIGAVTHDPPISKEEVPDGAWYCDMGTVHYHRGEKGDGKCPVCSMDLKHKDAKASK